MYDKPVKFRVTGICGNHSNDEDEVYTIKGFVNLVKSGMFTDYDGYGYPVKDGFADKSIVITPSKVEKIPSDATHIVWFNK